MVVFLNTILATVGVKAQIDLNLIDQKYIYIYDFGTKKYYKLSEILNDLRNGQLPKVDKNEDQIIVIVPHDFSGDQPRNVSESPGN